MRRCAGVRVPSGNDARTSVGRKRKIPSPRDRAGEGAGKGAGVPDSGGGKTKPAASNGRRKDGGIRGERNGRVPSTRTFPGRLSPRTRHAGHTGSSTPKGAGNRSDSGRKRAPHRLQTKAVPARVGSTEGMRDTRCPARQRSRRGLGRARTRRSAARSSPETDGRARAYADNSSHVTRRPAR